MLNYKVAVILVNYNGIDNSIEAIESLMKSDVLTKIILVDNDSKNKEGEKISYLYPNVHVICSKINLGFSGGNNLGITYALSIGYEYIVLLNNDTIVKGDMITQLLKYSNRDTISVPVMNYYDSPDKIWYGGGKINKITGNAVHLHKNETTDIIGPAFLCSFATGCCMMIHREILKKVGKLDELFFMYCEDTDYCIRLALNKINIVLVPTAKLWHKVSQSTGGDATPFSIYYMTRNRLNYIKNYKKFFVFTAYPFSLFTRYIRMWEYKLKRKNEWRAFAKAIHDHKNNISGSVDDLLSISKNAVDNLSGETWNTHKNICVVTWFLSINYGTCIQSYALTKFLTGLGYHVYVAENYRYYYGIKHPIETAYRLVKKVKLKINRLNERNIGMGYALRAIKMNEFVYSKMNVYKISSKNSYKKMLAETDVFITGSDQIWNPQFVTPPQLLSMANSTKKKIAYGSSIGVASIPPKMWKFYRKYLNQFDQIGVRENTAQTVLNSIIDKKIEVVLDPSFLLTKNQWEMLGVYPRALDKYNVYDSPYIFCYFIGKNNEWENDISIFAKKERLNIFCAMSESNIVPNIGIVLPEIGIEEFIWCLLHAEYIVTDSFHAAALSINFNKQFAVYKRFSDGQSDSQNSRIKDLLTMFELSLRLVEKYEDKDLRILRKPINYNRVNDILNTKRKRSKEFLENSIIGELNNGRNL